MWLGGHWVIERLSVFQAKSFVERPQGGGSLLGVALNITTPTDPNSDSF